MSTNNNTSRPPPASTNTKSDPSAQYPVSNEHLTGLDATTTDKVNPHSRLPKTFLPFHRNTLLVKDFP